ncbi:MAG TPA: spore germination protein [Pseudogracilibacillus sp.]|nr:spore germination protein [Pseudogracilibacillus sp.]
MSKREKVHYVAKDLDDNAKFMKDEAGATISFDLDYREIAIHDRRVQLYYVNGMVNDLTVATILKMLIHVNDDESESDKMFDIVRNRLVNEDVKKENQMSKLIDQVLTGLIIVFVDNERDAFIVDVRDYPGREPEEPDTERVIRGARDGFTESIVFNSALVRRRVRDKGLRNEMLHVGTRSKTDVCISYIVDIANPEYIKHLKKKIKQIDIDGLVMADKALAELFEQDSYSPFPSVRFTERPDVAAHHILSGYVVLFVDTSPSVIILPITYFDHMEHAEEYRQTPMTGTFTRWIRITAVLASIFLLPFWMLFVIQPELLPDTLSFIGPDKTGNIPIPIQIIIADLGVEFLRMAAIHTPTPLATALGLIAAVLIGDIAVDVGMFSPEVILYVAISTIGTYVTPSYEMGVANKFIKYFILLMTIFFGLNGFAIGTTLAIIYLIRLQALETPYFWPFIPFNGKAMLLFIARIPLPKVEYRPSIVHPRDRVRQQNTEES